jgi:hypothetical protein
MQFSPTEPPASSGTPYVGRSPRRYAAKSYSSPLLSVETFRQPAPSGISEHVAHCCQHFGSPPSSPHWQYYEQFVGHSSHCDMNHTVIASHDMTSLDIINTCFVCKLKQTCTCTKEKKLLVAEPCWDPTDTQINHSAYQCTALRPTRITAPNESLPFITSFLGLKIQSPEWIKPTTCDWCNCTTTTTNPAGSCGQHAYEHWRVYGTIWTTNGK